MGVTLAEAEVATRIRQKYLAALEADEWDLLPGEVVGRGFLRNYSTYLGLEPTEMIERRRAVADESLAAVLVNTSAGSALPPERKVDYRPKDVALKDEGDELDAPRQINWAPLLALVVLGVFAGLVFFVVTQLGPQLGEMADAAQRQIAALQAPAPEATPRVAATLPPNLTANAGQDAGQAPARLPPVPQVPKMPPALALLPPPGIPTVRLPLQLSQRRLRSWSSRLRPLPMLQLPALLQLPLSQTPQRKAACLWVICSRRRLMTRLLRLLPPAQHLLLCQRRPRLHRQRLLPPL